MRPNLAALLADPSRVADVPMAEVAQFIGELEQLKAVLYSRLTAPVATASTPEPDRLLTADDVHRRTQLSVRWLYRHANTLPFTRRIGRRVLFCSAGLAKWLASRRP